MQSRHLPLTGPTSSTRQLSLVGLSLSVAPIDFRGVTLNEIATP